MFTIVSSLGNHIRFSAVGDLFGFCYGKNLVEERIPQLVYIYI